MNQEDRIINWCGYEWRCHPLWGIFHPEDPLNWYDQEMPQLQDDGTLQLQVRKHPKENHPIGRCYVETIEEFKYGTFEWAAILPEGVNCWPALWLSSSAGWPPEIDVMEGWSGLNANYVKSLIFKDVKPTMHWNDNGDHLTGKHMQKSRNNILRCRVNNRINHFKCVWTPDYVDIYYNGHKVKRFKDKQMLRQFNDPKYKMAPIMSSSVYGKPWEDYGFNDAEQPKYINDFLVLNFKYTPLT